MRILILLATILILTPALSEDFEYAAYADKVLLYDTEEDAVTYFKTVLQDKERVGKKFTHHNSILI